MRINLTKKDLINLVYMQLGFSKLVSENLINDFLSTIILNIKNEKKSSNFKFAGYIEGNQIMDGDVNVIISDGFTGNIALKTAEGTANFIVKELKKSMTSSFLGKISSLLNYSNLNKFKKRLDPRLYNGAIFLGLDSPVVKSHGGTDFIGFSNSLNVCKKIVNGNLIEKIKLNIWQNENKSHQKRSC